MPDLRYDPVNDLWIAIAESRVQRPNEYQPSAAVVPLDRCPFCRGNESETPPAITAYAYDAAKGLVPAQRDWLVRVIPNRYPAFGPGVSDSPTSLRHGPYEQSAGQACRQELIIESPRHVESLSELLPDELTAAFLVYRERLLEYATQKDLKFEILFKNCRLEAGASLAHIHSQLFGLDFVPRAVADKYQRLQAVSKTESYPSLLVQLAEFERNTAERLIHQCDDWTLFCPFASRFPFQTWIVPRRQLGPFWSQSDQALKLLGQWVQRWVRLVEQTLDSPAYNVLIHNPPLDEKDAAGHFYVELFVRMGGPAGFEWGSNCWINTVSPETAAEYLRTEPRPET